MTPAEAYYQQYFTTDQIRGIAKEQIIGMVNQRRLEKLYLQGANIARRGRFVEIDN